MPSVSILAEPPVAVVDKVVDKHGTRAVAQAYLEYLYSDEGQEIAARHFYRPRLAKAAAKHAEQFPKVSLFTIDEVFGGWQKAQTSHFADGGVFDEIYQPSRIGHPMAIALRQRSVLPGFGLAMGLTVLYLSADRADPPRRGCPQGGHGELGTSSGRPSRARARWRPTG